MNKRLLKLWGRVMVYPLVRTISDVTESAGNTKETVKKIQELRAQRKEDVKLVSSYLEGQSPAEKFLTVSQMNGWSEKELVDQEVAARRTRIGVLIFGIFGFVLIVGLIFTLRLESGIARFIWHFVMPGVGILFLATCTGLSIRYAWWEYQLKKRELIPMRQYLQQGGLLMKLLA